MLDPSATERGAYTWTEQAAGVGHFAKYADKRLEAADTPSMIVQLALEMKAKEANPRDQAIIRDVAAQLANQSPKAKRAYDQPSKGILWDGEVAGYIITKAMAAGFYILCMLDLLLGSELLVHIPITSVMIFVMAMLGITGILLVMDLDRPGRFLYVILRPNWDSWLVRGAYVIAAFGAILTAHIAVYFLSLDPVFHKGLALLGIPLAWMTGAYTGWLLKQAKGRVEWAKKSNLSIAVSGTIEMFVFGGTLLLMGYIFTIIPLNYFSVISMLILTAVLYWSGFIHIRTELRKAQMESLL
jgi:hypothetical protein